MANRENDTVLLFQAHLRGHNGRITAMSWSFEDRTLVSSADDGSLYEWDIAHHGARVQELVIKSCSYADVTLDSTHAEKEDDRKDLVTYAVGSDRTIKQVMFLVSIPFSEYSTLTLTL